MKALGCGDVMITALTSLFMITQFVLGTVKEGSPTSCFQFIPFVNVLIKLVKEYPKTNGFLE